MLQKMHCGGFSVRFWFISVTSKLLHCWFALLCRKFDETIWAPLSILILSGVIWFLLPFNIHWIFSLRIAQSCFFKRLQVTLHPIQQKFFEFLGMQNCMHIFSLNPISPFHSPAGRPAMTLNRLEVLPILLYRLWAGIDPPVCRLTSWVMISCRRPVPLQEGNNNPWDVQRD